MVGPLLAEWRQPSAVQVVIADDQDAGDVEP